MVTSKTMLATKSQNDPHAVELYCEVLTTATLDVFESMVMMPIRSMPPRSSRPTSLTESVSAVLGLSGGLRGMLAVHCPNKVATEICGKLLGKIPGDVDEDTRDSIGEIANMVAGGVKKGLLDQQYEIELAVPSIIVGRSYEINLLSRAERILLPFGTGAGEFLLEFKYAGKS